MQFIGLLLIAISIFGITEATVSADVIGPVTPCADDTRWTCVVDATKACSFGGNAPVNKICDQTLTHCLCKNWGSGGPAMCRCY